MRREHLPLGFWVGCLLAAAILAVPAPALAKDCAAWNNWCRPACGDWNGYCAGQSLPTIIGRMAPQSFFADPWWHGQPSETPYREPRWQGKAPKAKAKAQARKKARSAKASAASSR
jgi:hypothetical protein